MSRDGIEPPTRGFSGLEQSSDFKDLADSVPFDEGECDRTGANPDPCAVSVPFESGAPLDESAMQRALVIATLNGDRVVADQIARMLDAAQEKADVVRLDAARRKREG